MLYQVSSKWSIDVWSFGVMILEIITGYPVHTSKMHLVSTANKKCEQVQKQGVFAVKDNDPMKIIEV
jgi:serine/threonine protein kinase